MANERTQSDPNVKPPFLAAVLVLGWLIPGAAHWYLGMKVRGAIIFVTITALFWAGIAFGGLRSTVDPWRDLWFIGQMCAGGETLAVLVLQRLIIGQAEWGRSHDIGVVYTGVAGLLNLLALFDAMVRASTVQSEKEKTHG